MAREKIVPDKTVLLAALDLLSVKGASFALFDVVHTVGLSRAMMIRRSLGMTAELSLVGSS